MEMEIIDYTEKSLVIFGEETKNCIEKLKQIGARYNKSLTHPTTKEKFSGWVLSKKQKDKLNDLLNAKVDICEKFADLNLNETKLKVKSKVPKVNTTPNIQQVAGFSMIVPKTGMKIKLKFLEDSQEEIHEIVSTKENGDGYIFEFLAEDELIQIPFYMIGKEWRCLFKGILFKPNYFNFVNHPIPSI